MINRRIIFVWLLVSPFLFISSTVAIFIHALRTPATDLAFLLIGVWAVVALISAYGSFIFLIFIYIFRGESLTVVRFIFSRNLRKNLRTE